jgi:hypothetical protein
MGPHRHSLDPAAEAGYPFDNVGEPSIDRFAGLAALYDPVAFHHLGRLGVGHGWPCLEMDANGGSGARFLGERVGPTGHVFAAGIDIETTWIPEGLPPSVEPHRHGIGVDPVPEGHVDLVHAGAVPVVVPDRCTVVARPVEALRPDGRLLLEELDARATGGPDDEADEDTHLVVRAREAVFALMRRRGADRSWARSLPRVIRDAGFVDIGAEGFFLPMRAAAGAQLLRANLRQVGAAIVAAGLLTSAEPERCHAAIDQPARINPASLPLISARGQRPVPDRSGSPA